MMALGVVIKLFVIGMIFKSFGKVKVCILILVCFTTLALHLVWSLVIICECNEVPFICAGKNTR